METMFDTNNSILSLASKQEMGTETILALTENLSCPSKPDPITTAAPTCGYALTGQFSFYFLIYPLILVGFPNMSMSQIWVVCEGTRAAGQT